MGDLITGDLAMDCLIRMHFESLPKAVLTCKNWKDIIVSPGYLRERIKGGHRQSIVVMMLRGDHCYGVGSEPAPGRLVVLELKTGIWSDLPPIPTYFNLLSRCMLASHCKLAVVGFNLVVINRQQVFIYSFISKMWRRGADMLDSLVSLMCVPGSDRTLYVVGMSEHKQMMSASAYDVEKDEWVKLPGMDTEVVKGDVMKVTSLSGKLYVFHRYDSGGNSLNDENLYIQTFDPATLAWGMVCEYHPPKVNGCMSNLKVAGLVGNVHVCREVAAIANKKCQKIADLPVADCAIMHTKLKWNKHLVVYMPSFPRGITMVHCLDLESMEWSNLEAPKRNDSEYVQSICVAEI